MKSSDPERSRTRRGAERTRIDIVPLIDIIFLLLAFFMFLTLSMVIQKGVPVNLAQAESGTSQKSRKKPVVISVREGGQIYWNKDEISRDTLIDRLRNFSRHRPDNPIHINADRRARHKEIIEIVDIIRRQNVKKVIFTVEPAQ